MISMKNNVIKISPRTFMSYTLTPEYDVNNEISYYTLNTESEEFGILGVYEISTPEKANEIIDIIDLMVSDINKIKHSPENNFYYKPKLNWISKGEIQFQYENNGYLFFYEKVGSKYNLIEMFHPNYKIDGSIYNLSSIEKVENVVNYFISNSSIFCESL